MLSMLFGNCSISLLWFCHLAFLMQTKCWRFRLVFLFDVYLYSIAINLHWKTVFHELEQWPSIKILQHHPSWTFQVLYPLSAITALLKVLSCFGPFNCQMFAFSLHSFTVLSLMESRMSSSMLCFILVHCLLYWPKIVYVTYMCITLFGSILPFTVKLVLHLLACADTQLF